MRRPIFALTIVMFIALVGFGCSSDDDSGSDASNTTSEGASDSDDLAGPDGSDAAGSGDGSACSAETANEISDELDDSFSFVDGTVDGGTGFCSYADQDGNSVILVVAPAGNGPFTEAGDNPDEIGAATLSGVGDQALLTRDGIVLGVAGQSEFSVQAVMSNADAESGAIKSAQLQDAIGNGFELYNGAQDDADAAIQVAELIAPKL
ncbi:MAG: hypothetical protein KDB86_13395 [Actinobacteria bacterium]|nr:hypothetical protein [Actinomycetota bacterium]MCB9390775.1 hypothetical protein [Acidimicrobiia bacterium]